MAKSLPSIAYRYTESFRARLAPLVTRADGYANKAMNVGFINYSVDEKVKSPTLHVATKIDHATSSYDSASGRVHQLSDSMLAELQELQASTATLSSSFQNTATSTVQLLILPHAQEVFADFWHNLSDTAIEFLPL
ncbi:hypothetical protein NP233_g11192 [Leucocoprinus birnbaumii]|uniref:Uncharacterized protein n=1 Tax=Leucocoprinus birnbaumii TaxID=56174 RepID=A0AAD5VGW2_9AGAR|nr:hypothetical protein NP233_g11192 [Leucocoprinus birnbaumii]